MYCQEQAEHLRAIMEAIADRASFPAADQDASGAPGHSASSRIDEEEEEEAVLERRQELFTLFRNAAKIGPTIACAVVRNRLQQIMADPSAPFPVRPSLFLTLDKDGKWFNFVKSSVLFGPHTR